MKASWAYFVIVAGVAIVFGGIVYDVLFAGIPYQDPPPDLLARYNLQAGIASTIRWLGLIIIFVGIILRIFRSTISTFRSKITG